MSLAAKVALILGAGPNIGASVAEEFSSKGYKVVLTSRKRPEAVNPTYVDIQGDLSNPQSVVDIFAQVRKLYGEPSVVIYNGKLCLSSSSAGAFNTVL